MFFKPAFLGAPVLATFLAFGATASAADEVPTPKYEVGLSYSGLHVNSGNFDNQRNGNGGSELDARARAASTRQIRASECKP